MTHRFVGLGENGSKIFLYNNAGTKKRQVLWGDWLSINENVVNTPLGTDWYEVNWAPKSTPTPAPLYIKKTDTTETRPLEIIFLDVGQGDGAVLITPERGANEKIIIIDAGEGENMKNFLNARFKAYRGFDFHSAILTHSDEDHYGGFKSIFADNNIGFKNIYQNGLVERANKSGFEKVGGLTKDPIDGKDYLYNLAIDRADIEAEFTDSSQFGNYKFPYVMNNALNNPKIKNFKMLSTFHCIKKDQKNYMPEFSPSAARNYSIEVLGPIVEIDGAGKPRLRKLGSYGETKNGHSVILRLHYGNIKILFGGDLNINAEKYLLKHYAGIVKFPTKGTNNYLTMINDASNWFCADVMKVCHHGSAKVTDAFLETVNPACFVISSGDEEGHVHPRPDLLGRLGKFGRGESPVLLSTELQRSTREKEDQKIVDKLLKDVDKQSNNPTESRKLDLIKNIKKLAKTNVDIYGSIYVKTDGQKLIAAFKNESGADLKKWFYFEYNLDANGNLILVK